MAAVIGAWQFACLGFAGTLGLCGFATWRGSLTQRLAGLQVMTTVAALLLVAMTYAFDQPSLIDLALTVAVLGLPGTILFAIFTERSL